MNEIDAYLANVQPEQKKELERVRKIIQKTAPDAVEAISYQIPTFKYRGRNLIHFAAFKNHMSIFPGGSPRDELLERLKGFIQAKGTIQFTFDHTLPEDLLVDIVKHSMSVIDAKLDKK